MEAPVFKSIRSARNRRPDLTNERIAELLNRKYEGTGVPDITPEQVADCIKRAKVPWGGFFVLAIQEIVNVPPMEAIDYFSNKSYEND